MQKIKAPADLLARLQRKKILISGITTKQAARKDISRKIRKKFSAHLFSFALLSGFTWDDQN